ILESSEEGSSPILTDLRGVSERLDDDGGELGQLKYPRDLRRRDLQRPRDLVLGLEEAAAQPSRIAHGPLIRTDVLAEAIFGVHGNERFFVGQGAEFDGERFIEVPGDKETSSARDELDIVIGSAFQGSAERRN